MLHDEEEIAAWGFLLLHSDSLGVPRGPCMMCRRCPNLRGNPLLCWPDDKEAWDIGDLRSSPSRCRRCSCPAHQHRSHETWLKHLRDRVFQLCNPEFAGRYGQKARQLPPQSFRLPAAAAAWDATETALYLLTFGVFNSQRDGPKTVPKCLRTKSNRPLVSVVVPSSERRHVFHRLLYSCFCSQTYEPKELVVVDTDGPPSEFLLSRAKEDPRLVYRHYDVADFRQEPCESDSTASMPWLRSQAICKDSLAETRQAWSLGLKRNIACQLARGDVFAHFDDDDLYAPTYLETMVVHILEAERQGRGANEEAQLFLSSELETSDGDRRLGPAVVTLSEWHLLDLSDLTFGFLDAKTEPLLPASQRRNWLYGWGFSYVYTRASWELVPMPDIAWCEDICFMEELLRLQVPVSLVSLSGFCDGLCAHSYHPMVNTSTCEFAGMLRCGEAVATPSAFKDLLPLASEIASEVAKTLHKKHQSLDNIRVGLAEKEDFLRCRGETYRKLYREHLEQMKLKNQKARLPSAPIGL